MASRGKNNTQRKLTAILCADVDAYCRRLDRLAFCLLFSAILALLGCENGTGVPDPGIASPPETIASENVIFPADQSSTAGSFLFTSNVSKAGSADPASEAPGPEAPSTAGTATDPASIVTPDKGKWPESHGLDTCYTATGPSGEHIIELSCIDKGIESLDGIEELHALRKLELNDNRISDLSPLAHLTRLRSLNLAANRVRDIRPLAALADLTDLNMTGNRIVEVAPLADLNRLVTLRLTSNRISDVDDLGMIVGLLDLHLDDNEISDVSSLRHLTSLKSLNLSWNSVTLGVRSLDALTEAYSIMMLGNNNIDCSDLDALEDALVGVVVSRPRVCVPY